MTEELFVTLKRNDRVEDLVPHIEKVAQPGTKVILVIPCVGGDSFQVDPDYRSTVEPGTQLRC